MMDRRFSVNLHVWLDARLKEQLNVLAVLFQHVRKDNNGTEQKGHRAPKTFLLSFYSKHLCHTPEGKKVHEAFLAPLV